MGDTVLVKQPKTNKLSIPFSPVSLAVEEEKGSMVTASNGHKTVTRNSSMFKVVPGHIEHDEKHEEVDEHLSADLTLQDVPTLDNESSSVTPTTGLRRSQRQTRPPARLADYVLFVHEK